MAFLAPLAEAGGAEAAAGGGAAAAGGAARGGIMGRLSSFTQGFLPFGHGGSGSKQQSSSPQANEQAAMSEIHSALSGH